MDAQDYMALSDTTLLGLCVWREARGEGELGQRGVAWCISNRVSIGGWWGSSVHGVILHPWQFSSFNEGDPNVDKWPADTDPSWIECQNIAVNCLTRADTDPTGGATSYYDISIPPPYWACSMQPALETGRLRFFRAMP